METQSSSGLSPYDYRFKTYRCCKCAQPIALSDESEALLVQEQMEELQRFNDILPSGEEERMRAQVREHESGQQFSLTQYVHCRCLAQMNNSEVQRLREKARFKLPSRATHRFVDLNDDNTDNFVQDKRCAYCHIVVNNSAPGFSYSDLLTASPVLYLHYACYARLSEQQRVPPKTRDELYNSVPALPQGDLDPQMVWRQNNAWEEAMARRLLSVRELEAYRAWRAERERQKAQWSAEQATEWASFPPDLETVESQLEGREYRDTEQVLNRQLAGASYPVDAEQLREKRIQLNLLRARGDGPIEAPPKRKLGED